MSIKLSICIPTYNRARYLAETLDNVIAQAIAVKYAHAGRSEA